MKKIYVILGLLILNSALYSCSAPTSLEEDALYDYQATEDDGEVNEDPEGNK